MSAATLASSRPGNLRRWTAFLGGGIAWTLHLLAIYAIGEFGCVSGLGKTMILGISAVAWMLIIVSVILAAVAAAATVLGYRDSRYDARHPTPRPEEEGSEYLSRYGWILGVLFVLIIVVESLPIFGYLDGC